MDPAARGKSLKNIELMRLLRVLFSCVILLLFVCFGTELLPYTPR